MNYFPQLTPVADDFIGPLPSASSVRQSDLNRLNTAWEKIQAGHGINVTGSPDEKQVWNEMLTEGIQRSPTFRSVISDIGNNTNALLSISVNLVSGDSKTMGDSYASRGVDLVDLSNLSFDKSAANPQQMTTGEAIVHFLAERVAAANGLDFVDVKQSLAADLSDSNSEIAKDFNSDHAYGLKIQNLYRSELGQLQVTGQFADPNDPTKIVQKLNDGSTASTKLDYVSWGDFIWNQIRGTSQSTIFDPGLTSNDGDDPPATVAPNIPDSGEAGPIDEGGTGVIGGSVDDGDSSMLNKIRSDIGFDPAQHWGTAVNGIAETADYGNPPTLANPDGIDANFNTSVQEGQNTAPVWPIDSLADSTKIPLTSPIAPEPSEMDNFNNPANTFSSSPESAFSSAGQISSFEPAASFTPSEPAENMDSF